MQRDAQRARDVIVASSCGAQRIGRVRHKYVGGSAGQHAQGFERDGHTGSFQAVVAMFPLREHLHQSLRLEPLQVHAGG